MQPTTLFAGHRTADLTEGKVHRIVEKDGAVRYVALFPKTWEPVGKKELYPTVAGYVNIQWYNVTEWEEKVLALVEPSQ